MVKRFPPGSVLFYSYAILGMEIFGSDHFAKDPGLPNYGLIPFVQPSLCFRSHGFCPTVSLLSLPLTDPLGKTRGRCNGEGVINNKPWVRFCDFNGAMFTLFQVLTTSNWHEIMYAAMVLHSHEACFRGGVLGF